MNNKLTNYEDIAQAITDIPLKYHSNWKETYQFFPEVCNLPYQEREKWKEFAWKILADNIENINLNKMCEVSFNTGYKEGKADVNYNSEEVKTIVRQKLNAICNEL